MQDGKWESSCAIEYEILQKRYSNGYHTI